jgi:hypothetical protein
MAQGPINPTTKPQFLILSSSFTEPKPTGLIRLSKGFDIWVSIGELLWLNINVTIFIFRMLVGSKVIGKRGTRGSVFPVQKKAD